MARVPLLIGCVLLVSLRASAQVRPLSLRDAVALAVIRNPALAAAGADLSVAEAGLVTARGLDDPRLAASTAWHATRFDAASVDSASALALPERAVDGIDAALSLEQPLPSGGQVGLELDLGYRHSRFATPVEASREGLPSAERRYTPALSLVFSQPLLRGFGAGVARAERRRASFGRDVAGARREALAATLVRDVTAGYWALAQAMRELEIRRASASAAREQLERVRANILAGKLPPSAAAEIEVAIAVRDDAVLGAAQALTDRQLTLGQLCGVGVDQPLESSDALPSMAALPVALPELSTTLARALARNPELLALEAQGRAGAVEVEVSENGLLPALDVSIAGGPLGNAPSARAAYEQITGFGGYAVTAGVALELPIGRHAARGARAAAGERLRRVQLDAADLAAQIRTAVARAITALETARRRAELLTPSLRAAALDLEAEKARFDAGRGSNFDVLRRQDALAVIQLLLLSTDLAALQANASLGALTGDILEQGGLRRSQGQP